MNIEAISLIALCAVVLLHLVYRYNTKRALAGIRNELQNSARLANEARCADNALVVAVLAREIANELMQRNFEEYEKKFTKLYYKWKEIERGEKSTKLAHLSIITTKYTSFKSFDELGTWAHVLYADGFNRMYDDELWDLYESIRLYDALSCDLDDEWRRNGSSISEKEREHVRDYCRKVSDTYLLAHLHKARHMYYQLKNFEVKEDIDGEWLYDAGEYKIKRVYNVAESRYGVYVKSMDRYGMWGVFVDDVAYTSFYAADAQFSEDYLDNLQARVCVDAAQYSSIEKRSW